MIGLTFLAIGLLWLALSIFLAIKLPKWFGVSKPVWRGLLGGVIFVILTIGPFVDHIVGMRQFEKLCREQTGLQILPGEANAKQGREYFSIPKLLDGYAISIQQRTDYVLNSASEEVIMQYNHFSTYGGRVGSLIRLGSAYECAVFQANHPDFSKYRAFRQQIELVSGKSK